MLEIMVGVIAAYLFIAVGIPLIGLSIVLLLNLIFGDNK